MFKKLVSNLPFNPHLLNQLSFYGRRLKQEQAVRRVGAIFMTLTLLVQAFAFVAPAKAADGSSNDLVFGGISTQAELLQHYRNNYKGLQDAYSKFHIREQDLQGMASVTIRSSEANDYYSVGRHANPEDIDRWTDQSGQYAFNMRPLYAATSHRNIAFEAFQGTVTATGQTFWILLDCANITIKGPSIFSLPVVVPTTPEPTAPVIVPPADNSYITVDCNEVKGRWAGHPNQRVDIFFTSLGGNSYGTTSATTDASSNFIQTIPAAAKTGTELFYAQITGTGVTGAVSAACGKPAPTPTPLPTPTNPVIIYCGSGPLSGQPAPNNIQANCPTTTTSTPQTLAAECLSTEVLTNPIVANQPVTVRVKFKNTGTRVWSDTGFRLGELPHDTGLFMVTANPSAPNRAFFAEAAPISQNGIVTFTFNIPAKAAGTYSAAYQMVHDGEAWFGGTCGFSYLVQNIPTPLSTPTPAPANRTPETPVKPQQPTPPSLEIIKDNLTKGTVKRGQEITYRLQYRNSGGGAAVDTQIVDALPSNTTYVRTTGGNLSNNNGQLIWSLGVLGTSSAYTMIDFVVKVSDTAANGSTICNIARIQASGGYSATSGQVCNTVEVPGDCPYKPGQGITIDDKVKCQECPYLPGSGISYDDTARCVSPKPDTAICSYLRLTASATPNVLSFVRSFEANAKTTGNARLQAFWYDFDGNGSIDAKTPTGNVSEFTDKINWDFAKAGTYNAKLTVKTTLGDITSSSCAQSVQLEEGPKPPIINLSKKVKNITQNLDDASTAEARPGDVLEYSLITTNNGGSSANNIDLEIENMGDVKFYADIIDKYDADYANAEQSVLRWGKTTIPAGQSAIKLVRVKIKGTIPAKGSPSSSPTDYDGILVNTYGTTTIKVKVPDSVAKVVEKVATTLPNTGPGMTLFMGFIMTVIVGYFFARSRLLAKEVSLIRQDYSVGV